MNTDSANHSELPFTIRPATEDDLGDILRIEDRCFEEDAREDRATQSERIQRFAAGCQLLVMEGQGVGFFASELWNVATLDEALFDLWPADVCSHHDDGHRLYISSVAIDPSLHGRGIASRFISACLQRLLLDFSQIEEVILTVAEDWLPARRLYARAGFHEQMRLRGFFGGGAFELRDGFLMSATRNALLRDAEVVTPER